MTCEQFWDGEPDLAIFYRKKHELFRKQQNQILWLQGLYNYEAVSIALDNAFRKKGAKPKTYISEPHNIWNTEDISKEAEKEKTIDNFRNQLDSLAKHFRGGDKNGINS